MNPIPEIIFENANLIVIDKPSGYLSVPSRMGKTDSRPVAGILLQEYVGQQIFPVHRLDEETSGLLLFAKTPQAQKILSRAFELHQVQKIYQALTDSKPDFKPFLGTLLKNKLVRGKKRSFQADHGQSATTVVGNIEHFGEDLALWTLLPQTGRSHQLRVQLALRGFPIVGDSLYGSVQMLPAALFLPPLSIATSAIGLRAVHLDFSKAQGIESLDCPFSFQGISWRKPGSQT